MVLFFFMSAIVHYVYRYTSTIYTVVFTTVNIQRKHLKMAVLAEKWRSRSFNARADPTWATSAPSRAQRMAARMLPRLVGGSSLRGGRRWWQSRFADEAEQRLTKGGLARRSSLSPSPGSTGCSAPTVYRITAEGGSCHATSTTKRDWLRGTFHYSCLRTYFQITEAIRNHSALACGKVDWLNTIFNQLLQVSHNIWYLETLS